jgi:hypothetical protein
VHLSSDEAEIVETGVFQRLRGVRQLAMANMVYPGLHTRFDQSEDVTKQTGDMENAESVDNLLSGLRAIPSLTRYSAPVPLPSCARQPYFDHSGSGCSSSSAAKAASTQTGTKCSTFFIPY